MDTPWSKYAEHKADLLQYVSINLDYEAKTM